MAVEVEGVFVRNYAQAKVYVSNGGTFRAVIDDVVLDSKTYDDGVVKIDNFLKKKSAKKRKIALPVVGLICDASRWSSMDKEEATVVGSGIVSGVNRTDRGLEFAEKIQHPGPIPKGVAPHKFEKTEWTLTRVMADTPENRKMLERFVAVRNEYFDLRKRTGGLTDNLGYGRINVDDYEDVLAALEENHTKSAANEPVVEESEEEFVDPFDDEELTDEAVES